MKTIYKTALILQFFFLIILILDFSYSYAAERIFYEDCEASNYSEHFLERSYGTGTSSYWDEFTSEVTRSNLSPHGGSYSMTYDPFSAGNPHAVVGYGDATLGNTSHFDLRNHSGRYWYFRWYQRWESGIDWGGYHVKLIYINYQNTPDFTYFLIKEDSTTVHSTLKDYSTYSLLNNSYSTTPETDDMQWHKMELFLDAGTTGTANGGFWVKVDGQICANFSGINFNNTISNNPIGHITGWPSNLSGSGGSGSARTWLDDLEIWTLNGPNDIPGEEIIVDVPSAGGSLPSPSEDGDSPPSPSEDATVGWDAENQAGVTGWSNSTAIWCVRVPVNGSSIINSGNQVEIGFKGRSSGDYRIKEVSIAERDSSGGVGAVVDSTWTKVTFNGASITTWGTAEATVPAGGDLVSDPITFDIQSGKDYYVTYMLVSPSSYLSPSSDQSELYFSGADHSNDVDWSGFSTQSGRLHALSKIYVGSCGPVVPMSGVGLNNTP